MTFDDALRIDGEHVYSSGPGILICPAPRKPRPQAPRKLTRGQKCIRNMLWPRKSSRRKNSVYVLTASGSALEPWSAMQ